MTVLLATKRDEFERHIWDHAADEFQAQFDERRELTANELFFLKQVHSWIIDPDNNAALKSLGDALRQDEDRVAVLLQICGLTRSKILSDLRASASAIGVNIPSNYKKIASTTGWSIAGPYLLKRLRSCFGHFDPKTPNIEDLFQALNQATWPGYIRQQRAKLSGHEAEYRVATLLFSLSIPFTPQEKAENPLCRDAQIDNISFDLIIPNIQNPKVVVKSTVHTANIGQYGESKDHLEMSEARDWINKKYPLGEKPTLLAFIDGIGFKNNRDGLNGVLSKSDEFCQFKSLWKAVVIAAKRLNLPIHVALPTSVQNDFIDFINRWNAKDLIVDLDKLQSTVGWIEAGEGLVARIG
ncbi:hypothetical protein [Acetobacter cerevisiae]|uniref:hypothetical protein n=1 Tax=Acetobacter cerevisiae TaxID=178900 RepID=UPI000AE003A5|nr:hypothetical protein [Acetobacter cerevisiae]